MNRLRKKILQSLHLKGPLYFSEIMAEARGYGVSEVEAELSHLQRIKVVRLNDLYHLCPLLCLMMNPAYEPSPSMHSAYILLLPSLDARIS